MPNRQQPTAGTQPVPKMPEGVNIERVTKYEVHDAADHDIGSTSSIWMDQSDRPAFIGIKTNWREDHRKAA